MMDDFRNSARRVGMVGLFALVTACGGGGGSSAPPPPPPPPPPTPLVTSEYNQPTGTGQSLAAQWGGIGYSIYSEQNNAAGPAVSAHTDRLTLSGSIPAGNSYGGILAVVYPPTSTFVPMTNVGRVAAQDYSGQSELRVVAGSSDATHLAVQLIPQGGPFNGCVWTAEVAVDANVAERALQLNETVWKVPASCTAEERSISLATALKHLHMITVGITQRQVANLANGVARSFTLGKLSFAGTTAAAIDYDEVVSTYNHPVGSGATVSLLYGAIYQDKFAEHNDATTSFSAAWALLQATVTVPVGNTYGGLLLGLPGEGSTGSPLDAGVVFSDHDSDKKLRIQIGSRSAGHALVRLHGRNTPLDSCVPSYVLTVDAMAVSRDIALDDPAWFVPDYCASVDRARTALTVVSDLRSVSVGLTERSVPTIFDCVARDFTLGEIAFVH